MERRSLPLTVEVDDRSFRGFAAIYYNGEARSQAKLSPGVIERFMPGCFDEWFSRNTDCLLAYDHDEKILLARRSSGSLTLELRAEGLYYSAPFDPSDPDHQRVAAKIRRGDVAGSSLTFAVVDRDRDQSFKREGNLYVREIRRVIVGELGPTPLPVYAGTSAELRSASEADADAILAAAAAACIEPPLDIEFTEV